MKKIVSLLSMLAFVLVIASCTKNPAKVLPKKDGKWNVSYTETSNGKSSTGNGTFTFTDTEITITDNSIPNLAFKGTWSYDKTAEKITITIDKDATVYTVSDMTRTSETWTHSDNGSTIVYKLTKP